MKNKRLKHQIRALERKAKRNMLDWKEGDTLYTYFKRAGMNSMAEAFEKDYKRLGENPYESQHPVQHRKEAKG